VGLPCLFGIALGWLVSLVAGRREHPGTAFTWRAVLSREPLEAGPDLGQTAVGQGLP
jgi:hypothetical protein